MKKRLFAAPFVLTAAFAHAEPQKELPNATDRARVSKRDDGRCWEAPAMPHCAPGVHCNPGPPHEVKCPLPISTHPERVQKMGDGCMELPEMRECPPNAHCNPGPPIEVECPASMKEGDKPADEKPAPKHGKKKPKPAE